MPSRGRGDGPLVRVRSAEPLRARPPLAACFPRGRSERAGEKALARRPSRAIRRARGSSMCVAGPEPGAGRGASFAGSRLFVDRPDLRDTAREGLSSFAPHRVAVCCAAGDPGRESGEDRRTGAARGNLPLSPVQICLVAEPFGSDPLGELPCGDPETRASLAAPARE